ncbi:cytochrome c-type biogenesis protein CcmH, partial [Cronobacter sakazakii]|nr:cytochrome c-type biogenesis protein CcmH [Cronobacter sakazakii]
GGVAVLVTRARRTRREPLALDEDEQERLRALLNEEGKRP